MSEEFRSNVMVDALVEEELNRIYGERPLSDEDLDAIYNEIYGDEGPE